MSNEARLNAYRRRLGAYLVNEVRHAYEQAEAEFGVGLAHEPRHLHLLREMNVRAAQLDAWLTGRTDRGRQIQARLAQA